MGITKAREAAKTHRSAGVCKNTSRLYVGVRSKVLGDGDVAYYVRWVDAHGKRMELKVGTKASGWSEKRASLKRAELMHTPTQGLATLAQVYPIFLSAKGQQVRFKTIHIYTHYCDMIIEKLGDMPINKLTPLMIESFLQEFQHKSARLRALLYMLLKAGLKLAKSHFRVDNVGVMENIQPPKIDDKRERFLSLEEIVRLKTAIKGDLELELFVALSLSTGARINGVCTIKKMDIDLDTQSVRLKDFKTNSHYVGFLNAECMELLRTHLEGLENQQGVFKAGAIYRMRAKLLKLFGVLFNTPAPPRPLKVVVHTLRHTFASHLAIKGTPIHIISKLLNHRDIKQTMRYAHLLPSSGKEYVLGLWG
ncbi:tyrosine-type recombinase/integrase [Helicobacter salomonis]|uniref:tyrosine-type recombinase/integrase n=1 Tax=Helicobacter salomonis TaxID=56878 RepID=UPI000CF0F6D1|nr:site-specific integrase [Helicobacter salomonis]